MLSGLETRDLVAAVQRADVARLTTIPGVGKKTAERIVLELKDRLAQTRGAALVSMREAGGIGDRSRCAPICCRRCRTSAIIGPMPSVRWTPCWSDDALESR